jgi:hypothetical protein
MNQARQILQAARLFYHLDDLCSLHQLTQQDLQVLQAGLTALIASLHATGRCEPRALPEVLPERSYVLLERDGAPNRLLVRVAGKVDRPLAHVPLFCPWGFTWKGYLARDTALAILADFWGETLSRRGFASGQPRYCQDYLAVANLVERRLRRGGTLRSSDLAAFLHRNQAGNPHSFSLPSSSNTPRSRT